MGCNERVMGELTEASYCDRCGDELGAHPDLTHEACRELRKLEPPRYCRQCRRRLVVQVVPVGWNAQCSVHGPVT